MTGTSGLALRPVGTDDLDNLNRALFATVAWNPGRQLPPYEAIVEHPQIVIFHRGWGRPGDLGVIAELEGEVVGVAFCRLFTQDEHGEGYVDEQTPEVAVSVSGEHRDEGIGGRLLVELADRARASGLERLSLSVDAANPARRLYERLGYRELSVEDDDVLMLLEL